MYYTYIIYSESKDRYYVGYTTDLGLRLEKHNSGNSRSTKSGVPWEMVYYEEYKLKTEAMARERAIKKKKSRKYIKWLINRK
ncbi:MAG: GIY-YIG nuclease family protein [Candidatus Marinimicrobia bacterium]|nr:GIY-YIG nuclease family protein [Candidatus Neomarinimicrobiota bacterium]